MPQSTAAMSGPHRGVRQVWRAGSVSDRRSLVAYAPGSPGKEARMLPRLLFWIVCAAAGAMFSLLAAAPWLNAPSRLLKLFAEDQAVRRTAFASALGLLVTASV